jgi:hypothetical protein
MNLFIPAVCLGERLVYETARSGVLIDVIMEWSDTFQRCATENVYFSHKIRPSFAFKFQYPIQLSITGPGAIMTISPVFSAAHTSRWDDISEDEHRPQRKRTRTSDGESQTETEVDVDYRPPARRVKPLPAHHRRQHDAAPPAPPGPAPETSTKENNSHGQYLPTGHRRGGGCKFRPSHIPPRTSRFYTDGGEDTYLDHSLVCPLSACHFLGCGILFHAVCVADPLSCCPN